LSFFGFSPEPSLFPPADSDPFLVTPRSRFEVGIAWYTSTFWQICRRLARPPASPVLPSLPSAGPLRCNSPRNHLAVPVTPPSTGGTECSSFATERPHWLDKWAVTLSGCTSIRPAPRLLTGFVLCSALNPVHLPDHDVVFLSSYQGPTLSFF